VQEYAQPLSGEIVAQGVRPPYLLYFGGRIPRKRLDWAMQVWARVADRDPDLSLVVCGLESDARAEWRDRTAAHLRDRLHCLGFVAEADLPGLYAAAEAVLYPTLYEGFGFPALESQAVGTPVLMSAVGSLAELAGPGAVVLPPQDLDAWVAAAETIRGGGRRRDEAAREWARGFSWARAWTSLAEVYRRVRG
jgi:alpha-1,3-rhamnosyl/mannosyltransferase